VIEEGEGALGERGEDPINFVQGEFNNIHMGGENASNFRKHIKNGLPPLLHGSVSRDAGITGRNFKPWRNGGINFDRLIPRGRDIKVTQEKNRLQKRAGSGHVNIRPNTAFKQGQLCRGYVMIMHNINSELVMMGGSKNIKFHATSMNQTVKDHPRSKNRARFSLWQQHTSGFGNTLGYKKANSSCIGPGDPLVINKLGAK